MSRENIKLIHGDCLEVLPTLDASSVDAVVTDAPYGLEFMGKEWDKIGSSGKRTQTLSPAMTAASVGYYKGRGVVRRPGDGQSQQAFHAAWAAAVLRVLKPAGYLLAFGGTRTYHRLACAVEDAGFEVRDCLMWLYGTGFPKGKGCLKPAWEPILLCRKPGPKVVPLGIEECRVPTGGDTANARRDKGSGMGYRGDDAERGPWSGDAGRWPANVCHDGSAEVLEAFAAFGERHGSPAGGWNRKASIGYGGSGEGPDATGYGDTGTAARYFMCCPPDETTVVDNCEYLWHNEAVDSSQEFNRCCENASLAVANSMLDPTTFVAGSVGSVAGSAAGRHCKSAESPTPGEHKQKTAGGIATGASLEADKSNGSLSTAGSGRWQTGQSPKATTFTIGTATLNTTTCPTCNCSLLLSITPCISENGKTTRYSLTVQRSGGASSADDTSHSENSNAGQPVLFKATASPASTSGSKRGAKRIVSATTPTCEPIESVEKARFFYCAKASRRERNAGLEGMPERPSAKMGAGLKSMHGNTSTEDRKSANHHPTVKPLRLMEWLVKLACPPGGTVLDPFLGSGTTLVACANTGRHGIGIERDPAYFAIAERRIKEAAAEPALFKGVTA